MAAAGAMGAAAWCAAADDDGANMLNDEKFQVRVCVD